MRIAITALLLPLALPVHALTIDGVRSDSLLLEPEKSIPWFVHFRISEPAKVTLTIFDARNVGIRQIESGQEMEAGEHRLGWDGRDVKGNPASPEAYAYVLEAQPRNGDVIRHDLSELTGGKDLRPREPAWDPDKRVVRYVLDAPARVRIRLGLDQHGPLMRTLLDWVPRTAGEQEELWDGMDASAVIDLSSHPGLQLGVEAFGLPQNTVIIGRPVDSRPVFTNATEADLREARPQQPYRMLSPAQRPVEQRGDLAAILAFPVGLAVENDLPIITGPVAVTADVAPPDRERLTATRIESIFFVDGQYAFENETGFLPVNWVWNPVGVNDGVHYLTVNVRGYDGNFAMATRKLIVRQAAASSATDLAPIRAPTAP